MTVQSVAKFLTALAGLAAQAISLGLASGNTEHVLTIVIGALTALAVFLVPNAPPADGQ